MDQADTLQRGDRVIVNDDAKDALQCTSGVVDQPLDGGLIVIRTATGLVRAHAGEIRLPAPERPRTGWHR